MKFIFSTYQTQEQEYFDILRKANPRTIIVALFQRTTGGQVRGGNMPKFNSSINSEVYKGQDFSENYAVCTKNRYTHTGLRFNILKKKILLDFIEDNFLKELEVFQGSIIVPLGNSVSSTIDYLNTKHQLKLRCFLKGFPHPSGLNVRKNIQFEENKKEMLRLLKS